MPLGTQFNIQSDGAGGSDLVLAPSPQGSSVSITGIQSHLRAASLRVQSTGLVNHQATGSADGLPTNLTVHVGDTVSLPLAITNTAPNDGLSENLIASIVGTSGGLTASSAPTGDIAPQATDSSMILSFSTAAAGTVQGTATVDYQSDGTGIDGSPPAAAGEQVVGVDATVDNYAQAAFAELSGPGTLTHTGAAYTLNLGHILQGSAPVTAGLAVSNVASGPADLLSGTFQTSGSSAFSADGFGVFIGLSAGNTEDVATVTLNTANAGVFSYTVTLLSNSSNADEYLGALPNTTLTVTASVQPAPDVSSITASTGTSALHFGQTTTLMLNMSETVIVTGGAPSLTLSDGGAAGFVGGSGTSILKFSYTVGSGDSDAPALAVSGLNLNGAVIRDGSGNSVNLLSAQTAVTGVSVSQVETAAVVTASNITAAPGQGSIAASTAFVASDPDGDIVTKYAVMDLTGSGQFIVNGVAQPANQEIDLTAAQLLQTSYKFGSSTDQVQVRSYDGSVWALSLHGKPLAWSTG